MVLKFKYDKLNELHQQTDCAFFNHDEETEKAAKAQTIQQDEEGFYYYGVKRFTETFPNVSIEGIEQVENVPVTEEI